MTTEEIKNLWGEYLFKIFANHIDENGWLTSGWADIIEDELPKYDNDYNDNKHHSKAYQQMYCLDMEFNEDETKMRPLKEQITALGVATITVSDANIVNHTCCGNCESECDTKA